jgi:hypothetical protein
MLIQIALDNKSHLHIIPVVDKKLCFDYDKGYCHLKSLSLVNAFLFLVEDNYNKVSDHYNDLVNGQFIEFYFHDFEMSLSRPEEFRTKLRQWRNQLEITNQSSEFFFICDDYTSFYTRNLDKIKYGLPDTINAETPCSAIKLVEYFDDNISVRLVYKYVLARFEVIHSNTLGDGGIQHLLKPPAYYNPSGTNEINRLIGELENMCDRYGWKLKYTSTNYINFMALSIYRYSSIGSGYITSTQLSKALSIYSSKPF